MQMRTLSWQPLSPHRYKRAVAAAARAAALVGPVEAVKAAAASRLVLLLAELVELVPLLVLRRAALPLLCPLPRRQLFQQRIVSTALVCVRCCMRQALLCLVLMIWL